MNEMKVRVEKKSTNDSTFRTPMEELDVMPFKPEIGKSLLLASSTHESGGIITSVVQLVEQEGNIYTVYTKNSVYRITILDINGVIGIEQ